MNREELNRYRDWLALVVIPGYEKRARQHRQRDVDWLEAIARASNQIADIDWRLETEPPRPAPECGWRRPYSEHGETCPKNTPQCRRAFAKWNEEYHKRNKAPIPIPPVGW